MKRLIVYLILVVLVNFAAVETVSSSSSIYKGIASWYSEDDPGVLETTANMEKFDDEKFTCAIWEVPFGTILKVTNLRNNKVVYVRVNDRGPAKRLVQKGRIIDLTREAFSKISNLERGLINVKVETI